MISEKLSGIIGDGYGWIYLQFTTIGKKRGLCPVFAKIVVDCKSMGVYLTLFTTTIVLSSVYLLLALNF